MGEIQWLLQENFREHWGAGHWEEIMRGSGAWKGGGEGVLDTPSLV